MVLENLKVLENWRKWEMDEENKKLKIAVITGASKAIRYKEENPRATEQEIIQHISDNAKKILEKMDEEF